MNLLPDFFKKIKTQRNDLGETWEDALQASPTLLAVSGGLDSMVLAQLFQDSGLPFLLAHCNFQLRGQESDEDASFVERLEHLWGCQVFVKKFDTAQFAAENGVSIQMAARQLRYAWFTALAEAQGCRQMATAHHRDDATETALLNFVRGTGLSGLTGIDWERKLGAIRLLRPLLGISRASIQAYALAKGLAWREDSSNAQEDYARNFMRRQIVPKLETLNPNFGDTAARNLQRLQGAFQNLNYLLTQWAVSSPEAGAALILDTKRLLQLPAPGEALRHCLKPFGFDGEQARQTAAHLEQSGFELISAKGFRLRVERQRLVVASPSGESPMDTAMSLNADDLMLRLPGGGSLLQMPDASNDLHLRQPETALLDNKKLQFPLLLRHWQAGDSFQPVGMQGKSQKLQDYFTHLKLSQRDKEAVWLLVNGNGDLVWVVGYRVDARYAAHEATEAVLKLHWLKG